MTDRKTTRFNKEAIKALPKNKPVVYKILDEKNENIYTGSAKRGRAVARLREHLPNGPDPVPGGAKVQIQQKTSIKEAHKTEKIIIARSKPKHNKQGK